MPTYEYICHGCGKPFEYFQSMKEEPKKVCEECGGKLERLVGAGAGFIFKGSGFYITDYAKGASTASTSPASASPAPTETAPKPAAQPAPAADTKKESKTSA